MMEDVRKICIRHRKGILQLGCAETLKEAQYQSLFDIFRNENLGRRMVQPYVEERHVETIYAQWKLQMDRSSCRV